MDDVNASIDDYAYCLVDNETVRLTLNLSTLPIVAIVLHAASVSLIIGAGAIANAIVLLLVIKDKRLRYTTSVISSLSIVLVDLLLIIFYHVMILANTLKRGWSYSSYEEYSMPSCRAYGLISIFLIYVRWTAIALMTIDRFFTVVFPFRYKKFNKIFLTIGTILVWLVPAVLAGILGIPIVSATFRANLPTCLPSCINVEFITTCKLLNGGVFTINFLIGSALPLVLYIWMYLISKKLISSYKLGNSAEQPRRVTVGSLTSQVNTFMREKKALVTVFLIFITVTFTSIPTYAILLVRQIDICLFFKIPIEVHLICVNIFLISAALDPIILMRTSDFRNALKDLLCGKCKAKVTSSSSLSHSDNNAKVASDTSSV
jgi:hypothetical protein